MHPVALFLLTLLACPGPTSKDTTDTGEPSQARDADADGFLSTEDCDDGDPAINPNAVEVCDGLDNDCDSQTDEGVKSLYYRDVDLDGFGDDGDTVESCDKPEGYVLIGGDCDDADPEIFLGALELCDGKDNNCGGDVDEGVKTTWYADGDGDGYGDLNAPQSGCDQPSDTSWNADDCDDTDYYVNPAAAERCNGKDDNCDGSTDGDDAVDASTWYLDYDRDGSGGEDVTATACEAPANYVASATDCDDTDPGTYPGALEYCDGADNDCDGTVDESPRDPEYFWRDADGDGYGDEDASTEACTAPTGYVDNDSDCDDTERNVHPGASELCNSRDDDCDGVEDESVTTYTWYKDGDGDGYGLSTATRTDCAEVSGYALAAGDCDDDDGAVHPGATELCNDADDDCDGTTDEGLTTYTRYRDADSDGYGDSGTSMTDCSVSTGWVDDASDCDDGDRTIHPGATEYCDGEDHDCDGSVYESTSADADTFYTDTDRDGYGNPDFPLEACEAPTGYTGDATDCDDGDGDINPGETDVCNGIDDDCSGSRDDGGLCPCDVAEYGDHTYLFCDEKLTWDGARSFCRAYTNYTLVTVDDASEEAWLLGKQAGYAEAVWWIGYADQLAETYWGWECLDCYSTYTNWCGTEPSNYHGWRCAETDEEDCAVMGFSSSECWNDTACDCDDDTTYGGPYFTCEAVP